MKISVERAIVFEHCLEAFSLYEHVFDADKREASSGEKGSNEGVYTILDMQFYVLDEHPEYGLLALKKEDTKPMWYNLMVNDMNTV
ncbi:MAG: hypothetical protein LBJ41_03800 [Treponema sp.]|jgi:hypothetical protein|nr:hypothetical protein [Treponema sp.]